MISDEAVEAAAKVMQAKDVREGFGEYPLWEYTEDVKALLEAAATHMLAAAWDEGCSEGQARGEDLYRLEGDQPNPYRSQA